MDYSYIKTDYIMSAMGGDYVIISGIIDLFKEQVGETNIEMNQLLAEKKYRDLGMLAHKVKSSAAILGMDELAMMLKNFELEAKAGNNIGNYPGYIEKFRLYTAAAIVELDDFINTFNTEA